ncbi:MAG: hypothetical protein DRP08_05595 [Candidatus Aenigmatarchaeota archaeon]|nr:MAG: hypothetical protein DRP08_05595 [Candidatus Aenigmarchaeota archaeon]
MAPIAEMGWKEFEYEVPKGWFGKEKKKLKYVEYRPAFPEVIGSEILAEAIKESLDINIHEKIALEKTLTHTRVRNGTPSHPRGEEPKNTGRIGI